MKVEEHAPVKVEAARDGSLVVPKNEDEEPGYPQPGQYSKKLPALAKVN